MRSRRFPFSLSIATAVLLGCDTTPPLEPSRVPAAPNMAKGGPNTGSQFATLAKLAPIKGGGHGEAYAVDRTGSVIAGYSWDRAGRMNPVTWRLQNGAWVITALPYAPTATSAIARAVNDQGDVAGNDWPGSSPHAVLWPSTGGFDGLGCYDLGQVYGISAAGRVLVGVRHGVSPATAAAWRPGSCREDLPSLVTGGGARAMAINGDATIVGGTAGVPVRWRRAAGAWEIQQLDTRPGSVYGANAAGDLVGHVQIPCASPSEQIPPPQCFRGVIWYAAGGSRELGTLGGETTSPRAINAAGEVVGLSALPNGEGHPFFWSEALGMRQLPVTGGAWAFGVSGVRPDGTRLVVGAGGQPMSALAWVVRNP
jgi:probable HAF family extracellular repeat protein